MANRLYRVLGSGLLGGMLMLGTIRGSAAPIDFDVSRDFSTNANPGGVWSYGWKNTVGGPMTLFNFSGYGQGENGVRVFYWSKNSFEPANVYFNQTSQTTTSDGGTAVYPPGTVWFFPGIEGHVDNFGVIRFTAPTAGVYRLETSVSTYIDGPTSGDSDFHVVTNGAELFGQFVPGNGTATYSNSVELAAGGTIDFAVGRGQDDRVWRSGLKIQARLSLISSEPEPPLQSLVVPLEKRNVAGEGAGGTLNTRLRSQQVYGANQFPGPITIRELRFRPWVGRGAFSAIISNIQINLSSTAAQPDGLSATYSANVGSDDTVVYSGSLAISSAATGPAQGPKDFDIIIQLQQPFSYDPARGNLLVDVRNFSGAPIGNIVDHTGSSTDRASRAFSLDPNGTTASTVNTGADIIQVVYTPVPPGPTYDLSLEFSTNSNPNGVWSYGWQGSLGGLLTLFNHPGASQGENGVRVVYWSKNSFEPSNVYFNPSSQTTTSDGGEAVYPPGTVWFFPGVEGHADNFGVIRFTVPPGGSGTYSLETGVRSYLDGARSGDTDFHILRNGTELFGQFLAPRSGTGYTNELALGAGDTIDFAIGRGEDNRVFGSGLKIHARLTLTSTNLPPPPPTNCVAVPSGVVSWWPGEDTAEDVADSNDGTLLNDAAYGSGFVGRAFQFDGGSGKIDLGDPENLRFTNAFTIEAWIRATGLPSGPHGQIFFRGDMRGCVDPYYLAMQPDGAIRLHIEDESGTTICGENVETAPLPTNQWKHVAGVFDSGLMRVYVDGVLAAETNTSLRPFADLNSVGAGAAIGNHSGGFNDQGFNGLIDELAVYSRALSQSEIQTIHNAGNAGKCRPAEPPPAAPRIVTHPESQTVAVGADVRFTVVAEGTAPLAYQWRFNGSNIVGATSDNLQLSNVQASATGNYSVRVSNVGGAVISSNAVLRVIPPLGTNQALVVPVEKRDVAGEGAGGTLNTRLRSQQVYGASQFPGPIVIRELRFRPWVGRAPFSVVISNIQINLSSTAAQPDGLNATYAGNVGSDDTVVYSGPLSISSAATGPAQGPKDFDIIIQLQQPFSYDPARGNLLVDVRNFSGAPIGNIVDHTGSSTDRASRAFSLDPNGTTASTVNTGADIIQIVYTPGPSIPPVGTYDVSRDFSTNSNPGEAWAYGWKSDLGGAFTPFTVSKIGPSDEGLPIFLWAINSFEPSAVFYNWNTSTATSHGGQGVFPPGTVWFGPGIAGRADNYGVIRFTLPEQASGTYRLETVVRSALDGDQSGDCDFHVVKNGTELFGQFLAPRTGTAYLTTVSLVSGDTIDFAIGRGEDGSEFGSGLKIQARLTLISTNLPPSPGTNCVAPASGLVSWWPAEGVPDDIVDSNHGVLLNGVAYGSGIVGGRAFQFDGGSGKIALGDPENLRFTNAFTIEGWILATGLPSGPHGQIFFRGDMRGCVDPYYLAMQPNGAIRLHIEDESGTFICGENVETEPLPLNEWKHVAGVFEAGAMRIYVDGVLVAETNTSLRPFAALSGGGAGVAIGNHSGGFNDQGFNGLIDELAVYGRALSVSEVQAIFSASSAGKCRPPEPPPADRAFVVGTPPDAQEGEMVSVPLTLVSDGEVGGFSVVLRYDQDYLSHMDVTWGSALENAFKQADVSRLGRLRLVVATSGEAVPSGTQLLATLNFRARTTPEDATSQLRLQIEDVSSPAGEVLETPTDVQNGTVTVLGGNSTDNNGNNRIDVGDGTLLMRMLGGVDSVRRWDLERNDFNGNGMLDSGDVIKIFRIAAGLDPQPQGGGAGGGVVADASQAAATGEAAILTPARVSATAGQLVRLQVRLQNIESWIAGASFTVNYPTGALRLAASQPYRVGAVPGNALAIWNASHNGQIRLAVGRDMPWPVDSGGVLAELTFQVLPGASQQHIWQVGLSGVEITPDGYAPRTVASTGAELVGRAAVGGSLSAPRIGAAGEFTFTANGDAGATYELQASSDLVNWQTLTTFVNATGSTQVSDPDAVNHTRRFYRLVPVR